MSKFLIKTFIISFVITFVLFCFSFYNLRTYVNDIKTFQNKIKDMNETQMMKEYNTTDKNKIFNKLLNSYIKNQEDNKILKGENNES